MDGELVLNCRRYGHVLRTLNDTVGFQTAQFVCERSAVDPGRDRRSSPNRFVPPKRSALQGLQELPAQGVLTYKYSNARNSLRSFPDSGVRNSCTVCRSPLTSPTTNLYRNGTLCAFPHLGATK